MNTLTKQTETSTPVKEAPKTPLQIASNQIAAYMQKGTINLPEDYSPGNALKEAWITIQSVENLDKKPALSVCTQDSVVLAMLDMVIQGLNPQKKQCYFIVYGSKLICQRSYFGDMALALRIKPGTEFYYNVVREGEEFVQEFVNGVNIVASHKRGLASGKKILGAYFGARLNGVDLGCDVMDIERIKKSWGMSKTYKPDGNSPHNKFEDEMAIRTVCRHYLKPIINSSNDAMLIESVRRQEIDAIEGDASEIAALSANAAPLELPQKQEQAEPTQGVDQETGEVTAAGGLEF